MRSAAHLTTGGWRYLTSGTQCYSGAGIPRRPRLDASGSLRVLGRKPVLQTIKNSEPAALAADWPIELRFHSKTVALAALQYRTN